MSRYLMLLAASLAFISPYTLGWYGGWWKFIPASITIIIMFRYAKPSRYREILGLKLTTRLAIYCLAIGLATFLIARALITSILEPVGYFPGVTSQDLGWHYLSIFQVLNEEMIFRAVALNFLVEKMKNKFKANVAAAAIFAALHFFLYRFTQETNALSVSAIISLFAFSLACNSFFLMTRSIAIPFVIHMGWNLNKFGSYWTLSNSGELLSEATGFNLIEGNPAVLLISISMALLAFYLDYSRSDKGNRAFP